MPNPVLVTTSKPEAQAFAAALQEGKEALVVLLLHAHPPGLEHLEAHTANATLWAFTQQAALAWAPRRIRVNALGLGASPYGPFAPQEQAGRAAAPVPASGATQEDIDRTIRFMAECPSMTGQIVRLGKEGLLF